MKEETFRKKDIIFAANSYPEFDRMKANFAWREDLYADVRLESMGAIMPRTSLLDPDV
jgi:hypothetical protein